MINPTFCETITHYHQRKILDDNTNRNIIQWVRTVYKECYFNAQMVEALNGNILSQASSYTAKIPFRGKILGFSSGDIIVKGEVLEEIQDIKGERVSDLIVKYKPDCFTVRAVSDNTKIIHGAHYKLNGA